MINNYTFVCSNGEVYFKTSVGCEHPLLFIKQLLLSNKYKSISYYVNYCFIRDYDIRDIISGIL